MKFRLIFKAIVLVVLTALAGAFGFGAALGVFLGLAVGMFSVEIIPSSRRALNRHHSKVLDR